MGSNHVVIGPVQGLEGVPGNLIPHGLEAGGEIGFDCSQVLRGRHRMPLSDHRVKVGEHPRSHRLRNDLGPDTLVGKNFQQDGMGHTAVDNMGFSHTAGHRIQTGMHFR